MPLNLPIEASGPLRLELKERVKAMEEIIVRAEPPKFQQRGDTTDFRASAYRTEETNKVEDLLRQLPGVQVGTDGRLTFNGKEVEAVMIEGENLTEANYQVLTRNLNAATVDRIQVVQQFQENRLMRDVAASDKVGINLTIDRKFKGKLSGSTDLALGTNDRRQADINLIYLRQKIKWIQFLQYNNIGMPPNGGMDYLFDTEGGGKRESSQQRDNGLLKAGALYPPDLSAAYINQNSDYSGYSIFSWKMGKTVQAKALLAASDSRLALQSEGEQTVFQPGGFSWENFFLDQSSNRAKQYGLRFNIRHDAGKRNLGSAWIDLQRTNTQQLYANLTTGAVTDSLREQLQGNILSLAFRAEESVKLRSGTLLQIGLRASHLRPEQDLLAITGRFAGYFNLDTLRNAYKQNISPQSNTLSADASFWARKKQTEYTYGIKAGHLGHEVAAKTSVVDPDMAKDSVLSNGQTSWTQSYARLFGQVSLQQGKKSRWMLGGFGGLSRGVLSGDSLRVNTGLIYLLSAGYTYSISSLSVLSVQAQAQRDAPANGSYYPDSILTGQVSVLNGATTVIFPANYTVQVSYASNALHKGRVFFVSASWSRSDQQFVTALDLFPAYTVQQVIPLDGNRNLGVVGKFEQHVKSLQSKFSVQLSSSKMRFNNVYNGVRSAVLLDNVRIQPEWVSTFGGPINAEVSYTFMYSRNKVLPDDGLVTSFSQWQHRGYAKLKARVHKKAYLALQYARYRLSPGETFHTLDLFARWNAGKKFSCSLSGHNLLNNATISQRQISPNMEWTQGFGLVGRYLLVKGSLTF
jgi:hypothetical protein